MAVSTAARQSDRASSPAGSIDTTTAESMAPSATARLRLASTFGKGGVAESLGGPKALLVLPGDETVIASSNSNTVFQSCCWNAGDFVLSRYRPDGNLNTDFDGDGRVIVDVGDFDEASALALSPDGKIVLAGGVASAEDCGAGDCAFTPILARFTPSGALDPGFGQGGRTPVAFPGGFPGYGYVPWIAALAIAPNGQILAAGGAGSRSDAFVVAREPNGQPDPSFGSGGSTSEIRTLPSWTEPLGLAIQPNDKILVSASSSAGTHAQRGILLGLTPNGRPDPMIGSGAGLVPTETMGPVRADRRGDVYQVEEAMSCDSTASANEIASMDRPHRRRRHRTQDRPIWGRRRAPALSLISEVPSYYLAGLRRQ
jgi:uncharacterized delta-60 repeat protein